MSQTSTAVEIKNETWELCRKAFERLLAESVPAPATPEAKGTIGESDLKRVVTETVSAILVEGNVLEKFITRTLQKLPDEAKQGLVPQEMVRQICEGAFRSLTLHHLVPVFQKQIKDLVHTTIAEFGKTEEFKDMIDSRFRVMEQYMRSEVIPKVIEKVLTKA